MAKIKTSERKYGHLKVSVCFSWPSPSMSIEFERVDGTTEEVERKVIDNDEAAAEKDGQGDE